MGSQWSKFKTNDLDLHSLVVGTFNASNEAYTTFV
jgi:hypothetical protein